MLQVNSFRQTMHTSKVLLQTILSSRQAPSQSPSSTSRIVRVLLMRTGRHVDGNRRHKHVRNRPIARVDILGAIRVRLFISKYSTMTAEAETHIDE